MSQCRKAQELEDGCAIRFVLDTKGPAAWRPTGRGVDYWVAWRPRSCSLVAPETGEFITQGPSSKSPDRRHVRDQAECAGNPQADQVVRLDDLGQPKARLVRERLRARLWMARLAVDDTGRWLRSVFGRS